MCGFSMMLLVPEAALTPVGQLATGVDSGHGVPEGKVLYIQFGFGTGCVGKLCWIEETGTGFSSTPRPGPPVCGTPVAASRSYPQPLLTVCETSVTFLPLISVSIMA